MATPESLLKRSILQFLETQYPSGTFWMNKSVGVYDAKKGIYRKNNSRYDLNGVSDILGLLNGIFVALEVKTPSNKKRPQDQADFVHLVQSHGHLAAFVTSVDQVEELLRSFFTDKGKMDLRKWESLRNRETLVI